jgi:dTDP-4-amino-4,6-dideoxygalactose transaminase
MTCQDAIPFLDLAAPHVEMEDELVSIFRTVLRTAGFVGGPIVADFEREFAAYCGAEHCIGVGNGTDAVRFALMAAGVAPGDIVVTVPHTFIATAEAISQAGALPEFVDIDEQTYTMDPEKLKAFLENRCQFDGRCGKLISRRSQRPVSAIVPVHLYGQMADMDPLLALASQYGLRVIEDACQAHGAEYFSQARDTWQKAGTMGDAAAFSFYPGKNLGACGEAGAVVTEDAKIADRVRMLRDHGQSEKYEHQIKGFNGRLDALQAGILRAKLPHLSEWNQQRREVAERYLAAFAPVTAEVGVPCELPYGKGVYHLYVIRHAAREELKQHLAAEGIFCGLHYPVPLHLQQAYSDLGYHKGDFPITEKVCAEILSLPMYPQLTIEQQTKVVNAVLDFVQRHGQRAVVSDNQ